MWKIKLEKSIEFSLAECLRGHTGAVTCIAASRPYSVIVSGSEVKEWMKTGVAPLYPNS